MKNLEHGLNMEMTKYKLGDIAKTGSGGTPKSTVAEYYENGTIPWINSGELNHPFISSTENFITQAGYDNSSAKLFPPQTVLLAMYGATAGKASLLEIEACTNQAVCAIMPDEKVLSPLYLKYKLDTMYNYLVGISTGSARDNLSQEGIRSLELNIHSLAEQKKIAAVLSALDDKIALNKKMNQKLEAMAKRLYDYWFVQFDFPDENGRPYKTSGGPMTHNPTLNREIPVGWEVDVVGNVCETVLGGTPSTENESFWNGNIPWLNSGEVAEFPILNAEKRITEDAVKNSATAYLPAGSVTLSITRHLRPSIMAIDACINQSVAGIKENDILKNGYLYPYLVNEIPRLNTLRGGAQQPHINKDTVDKSPIVIPAQNVLHQYYEKVNPLYKEIIEKAKESQKLTALRDKLLPLLMNDQVEV
ncbi:type I restriction enzyme, S subunit [Fibrobacter sp. UWH5]|uniref:restriction endonuclease subunit S n=1 Tax=Fibrobacter sp. UWH5 TaxID=1896211 RepID=UPI00091F2BB5|nr:restriction endonuclease subunit S [Fibrobacter sp. UWH5]SHL31695.1 type I restriction enzyme, S subunit [Fibrobacter sp. UWH5]